MTKGHKVMIIDDDSDIREILHKILIRKGYEVTLAIGAEQALGLIKKEKPDVIVLDYNMPNMNGIDFLKRLREFDTQLPVIMLTGYYSEILESEVKKLGVYDFLRKGISADRFIECIKKFVEPARLSRPRKKIKGTIMVADDDPEIRTLLKRFLTKKDYEVIVFENAEKLLEKLKDKKPNMILLDINLPGMDGITALKKIKAIDKSISTIMISGNTETELAKEAMTLGASDYVLKPFNLEYLELSVLTKIFLGES